MEIYTAWVQGFFANRIRIISGSPYIASVCWLLSFLRLVGYFVAAAAGLRMTSLMQSQTISKRFLTIVLALGAVVDVIITVSLCYFLRRETLFAGSSTKLHI